MTENHHKRSFVSSNSNTTGATSGTGAPAFTSGFSGIRVVRSLGQNFENHFLSLYPFSFGHCVVFSSTISGFWLSLRYLQTFLVKGCRLLELIFSVIYGRKQYEVFQSILYHSNRCSTLLMS